ncbi:DUF3301 domain-containing protein [Pseudomonas mangrovi]|uniref:DUF3301 domain-containing protein n=1 Tax=Pseudomonas mangrovi TaxID=2161748 RepID=A0A2T5P9Q4_9PSED|nr:DUF3301 domain-containing protein [Pseudomonas mangrovi]PTU74478.1 DUF3301 domain-containing protein [Pseudomonas mangrovi]
MLTLGNFSLFLVLAALGAWLWRAHGLREHALALVRRHCQRLDVELLDGNVAFRRLAWLPDARGQRRLARIYDFEFTVTGEQRLRGNITLFGRHPGRIELDAHPFPEAQPAVIADPKVISLSDWRREHPRSDDGQA